MHIFKTLVAFQLIILPLFADPVSDASPATLPAEKSQIITIDTMAAIPLAQPANTIFFFDVDDTLIDFPQMLGSKAWRQYIVDATKEDKSFDWHDHISFYINRHYPVEAVEPNIANLIHDLQNKGYAVYGLTSRERNKWYDTPAKGVDSLTIQQLKSVGINLDKGAALIEYPQLLKDPEYYKGVFFSDTDLKGDYLIRIFKEMQHLPDNVIFVDDKLKQVKSVAEALDKLGIKNSNYLYTATEKKTQRFDPLIANIELFYFLSSEGKKVLTDAEASDIAARNPDKNADFYLRESMSLFKAGHMQITSEENHGND